MSSGTDKPILRGERVVVRPAEERDVAPLVAILNEPAVRQWWGDNDADDVRAEHLGPGYVIEVDGDVAGLLLVDEEEDRDYRCVGLDIALATARHGQGLAREALQLVIDHWTHARGHHRFTIDPTTANEQAIRSYAGLGFREVGVMRQYERAPDGSWRDGLYMELLTIPG
jgi:aminoglycoside 6'-N-acetyltransferase